MNAERERERERERGRETATPTKSDRVAITDGTVDQRREGEEAVRE